MSSCAEARGRFADYLGERLGREERQDLRRHLQGCDACREEASSSDPAFLFAFVEAGEVSADETARILSAVRTGIELKKTERRVEAAPRGRLPHAFGLKAAVSAAAAVLVALFVLPGSSGVFQRSKTVPAGAAAAAPAGAAASSAGTAASLSGALVAPGGAPQVSQVPQVPGAGRVSPFAEASGPAVGQKLPADATIYDWNPGGGQPRVVWIVDRSLDI